MGCIAILNILLPLIGSLLNKKSDIQLLEAIKSDDYAAFNCIYDRYWERLFSFGFKITKDKELAIQITQDVFVQLWEARKKQEIHKLDAYMFQSVKYRFFQIYKSRSNRIVSLTADFEEYLLDQAPKIVSDRKQLLVEALELLPEKKKEILLMNIFQDMKPEEIAHTLGLSTQTVRNQLSAAIKQLRAYFKNKVVEFPAMVIAMYNYFM